MTDGDHLTPRRSNELTGRELDVLALVVRGYMNYEIAAILTITEYTVDTHMSNMLQKLRLRNRTQLAVWAVVSGKIPYMTD